MLAVVSVFMKNRLSAIQTYNKMKFINILRESFDIIAVTEYISIRFQSTNFQNA